MSMAGRFSWASLSSAGLRWLSCPRWKPSRVVVTWLAIWCVWGPVSLSAQPGGPPIASAEGSARQVLDLTLEALGGKRWINLQTVRTRGRTAAFFQGQPTGTVLNVTITTKLATKESPAKQFVDLGDKGKLLHIFAGEQAWEITYKGKKNLPREIREEHLRWRDHSPGVILRRWYANPATMVFDGGRSMVNLRPVNTVTLINPSNDSVTLDIDAENHLPLRLSFEWRDPRFHDKNLAVVEYDNYQDIDGIATPFTVTWLENGAIVRQRFLRSVEYDVVLADNFFDPDRAARKLK